MTKSILDYFPKPYTPRDVQTEALLAIEKAWDKSDIIVINLPVASGKSYISKTILDWQGRGVITTPTNILVDQYVSDFPKLAKIYGRDYYDCKEKGYRSCGQHIKAMERAKAKRKTCEGCPWLKDNRRVNSKYVTKYITNNHLYAQMQKYMPVLVADEAHNLVAFLQDWHSSRIDYDRYPYPRRDYGKVNRAELLQWLTNMVGIEDILDRPQKGQKALRELYKELTSPSPRYIIKEEVEAKAAPNGTRYLKYYLKLCPVDIRTMPPILWPGSTKIVLMSATIGYKDIEELGLSGRRVSYIEAVSCIPAENRPVIIDPAGTVRGANLAATIDSVSDKLLAISDKHPGEKGLIHATYAQARLLRQSLSSDRFIYHDSKNKKEVYQNFRTATDDRILVASGMYEGIDLPGDFGRWQVIAKTPWPNLGEPAVSYRAKQDKDWYAWQATKVMLQACGRICRKPEDYGVSYIIDSSFKRLYNQNQDMFPDWYKESVSSV